jgi:hypothetical protein
MGDQSVASGGLASRSQPRGDAVIAVVGSSGVAGKFALHRSAGIPLPIVPERVRTTFFISIFEKFTY